MMTDPIADMLTRIRNAVRIERTFLDMPTSKMRRGIAQVLKDEGYVWDFEEIETTPARTLRLHMKYGPNGERLITKIDRISKPGRRIYRGYKELKPVLGGMGIQILSTPRGIVSDRRARVEKIGGEVLAMILLRGVPERSSASTAAPGKFPRRLQGRADDEPRSNRDGKEGRDRPPLTRSGLEPA